jgi:hypothetical protein
LNLIAIVTPVRVLLLSLTSLAVPSSMTTS